MSRVCEPLKPNCFSVGLAHVLQAALDNQMMLDDLKRRLVAENPGHNVEFRVTGGK